MRFDSDGNPVGTDPSVQMFEMILDRFESKSSLAQIERDRAIRSETNLLNSRDEVRQLQDEVRQLKAGHFLPSQLTELTMLLRHFKDGNKIAAIKCLRSLTGQGLKEAKDTFEFAWDAPKLVYSEVAQSYVNESVQKAG